MVFADLQMTRVVKNHLFKYQFRVKKEIAAFFFQISGSHTTIFRINIYTYAVPSISQGRYHCCTGAAKWVEDFIPVEGEHSNQTGSQLKGERGRVISCRRTRNVPDLPKPAVKILFVNFTQLSLFLGGFSIAARFSLH